MVDDQVKYERARKRVRQLKGFYKHLTIYVLVNTLLVIVNLVTSPDRIWFYWPLLGWGIGLLAHAASVFMYENPWGKDWEDRKIKELMDKDTSR